MCEDLQLVIGRSFCLSAYECFCFNNILCISPCGSFTRERVEGNDATWHHIMGITIRQTYRQMHSEHYKEQRNSEIEYGEERTGKINYRRYIYIPCKSSLFYISIAHVHTFLHIVNTCTVKLTINGTAYFWKVHYLDHKQFQSCLMVSMCVSITRWRWLTLL